MATSQNGWRVRAYGAGLRWYTVPGTEGPRPVRVRLDPDAAPLLLHVAARWHESVEPLNVKAKGHRYVVDDWSWAWRPIRGRTSGYSNHASGTAIDLNATRHPLGVRGSMTREQAETLHRAIGHAGLDGLVRWGGDYHSRADEMHVEVVCSRARAREWARAARVRVRSVPGPDRTRTLRAMAAALVAAGVLSSAQAGLTPAPTPSSSSSLTPAPTPSSSSSRAPAPTTTSPSTTTRPSPTTTTTTKKKAPRPTVTRTVTVRRCPEKTR